MQQNKKKNDYDYSKVVVGATVYNDTYGMGKIIRVDERTKQV